MNNKRSHINAFTVIEAVIGMVVTAIIMAIIFVVFTVTSERMADFKASNEEIVDLNRINYAINEDVFKNEFLDYVDEVLIFTDFKGNITLYRAEKEFLVRSKGEFNDTFRLNVVQIYLDTLTSPNKAHCYKRIKLSLKRKSEYYSASYYKKIYPAELIKKYEYEH